MTVRVAWIFRELRGVVANVDLIAAVRGLAHKEAVHFFSQHKEKWLRTQWMGMERIALAEITVINGSPGSHRTMEDVEVCPLAELFEAVDAIAAVQGQPVGADNVCARLQNSMQEYGRKQLEHRLQELSDDQANIKVALKSIFTVREPSSNMTYATAPQHSNANLDHMLMSAAKPCVALAELKGNPAPAELRSNEATSTSSHSSPFLGAHSSPFLGAHSSPYLGAINAVQRSTGSFWLYDPVPSAPAGGGGGKRPGAKTNSGGPDRGLQ